MFCVCWPGRIWCCPVTDAFAVDQDPRVTTVPGSPSVLGRRHAHMLQDSQCSRINTKVPFCARPTSMVSSKKESRYSPTPDRPCLLAKGKGTLRLACSNRPRRSTLCVCHLWQRYSKGRKHIARGTKHLNSQVRKQLTEVSN